MKQIVECIPNVSEGKDVSVINTLKRVIKSVDGVDLLHIDRGKSANRTVFTFIGTPIRVIEAGFLLIKHAYRLIDMSKHKGVHPRIGAVDVCPFVPLQNISIHETVKYAHTLAQKVGNELEIPVYCYGNAAKKEERTNLARIRKGEYEGLKTKIFMNEWKPDFGPVVFNKKFGAMAIGARNILIAYNVNLQTKNIDIVQEIASRIRQSGKKVKKKDGKWHNQTYKTTLQNVKALGWYLPEYGLSQVTTDIIDTYTTPIHVVYETIIRLAKEYGIQTKGSEIVGLVPLRAIIEAGRYYADKNNEEKRNEEDLANMAIQFLGLNTVSEFIPQKRIIEYIVQ